MKRDGTVGQLTLQVIASSISHPLTFTRRSENTHVTFANEAMHNALHHRQAVQSLTILHLTLRGSLFCQN